MKYKLRFLELEGFRSFKKRVRIDFPESGLVLIAGKYKGSSVSSGSGKSSILEAIAFALDICEIPATELKNWDSKSLYVKLGIECGSTLIECERTPKFNLIIDGVPWSDLVLGGKEKLYKLLGVPDDVLPAVTYRRQRERGKLLNYTDAQLKEFLSTTLKLNDIEDGASAFNKKINALEPQIDTKKAELSAYTTMGIEPVSEDEYQVAIKSFQDAQVNAEALGKEIEQKKLQLNAQIEEKNKEIAELHKQSASVVAILPPEHAVLSEELKQMNANLGKLASDKTNAAFTIDSSKEKTEIAAFNQNIAALNQNISQLRIQEASISTLILNVERKKTDNNNIKASALALKQKATKLQESMCPTCNRHWLESKVELEKTETEINALLLSLEENNAYIVNSEPTISTLPSIKEAITKNNNEISANNVAISAKNAEIKAAVDAKTTEFNVSIMALNGQIEVKKMEIKAISDAALATISSTTSGIFSQIQLKSAELTGLKQNLSTIDQPLTLAVSVLNGASAALNTLSQRKQKYAEASEKIKKLKADIADLERQKQINFYASKVVGRNGFLGYIFDETLANIQSRTNEMVAYIPNIEDFTLGISSTKHVKSTKSTKKEISITVSKGGNETSVQALSGGQQAGLELFSDLATAKEIRRKSGSAVDWMILDEAMDGLGVAEKAAALNIIKQKFDGLVLVIDHSTEVKEAFEKVIEIEYDGKESHVTSN